MSCSQENLKKSYEHVKTLESDINNKENFIAALEEQHVFLQQQSQEK